MIGAELSSSGGGEIGPKKPMRLVNPWKEAGEMPERNYRGNKGERSNTVLKDAPQNAPSSGKAAIR
jgi:hypothetical protein